jgi:hypothetical protein
MPSSLSLGFIWTNVLSLLPSRIFCFSYAKELLTAMAMVSFTGWISHLIYVAQLISQAQHSISLMLFMLNF